MQSGRGLRQIDRGLPVSVRPFGFHRHWCDHRCSCGRGDDQPDSELTGPSSGVRLRSAPARRISKAGLGLDCTGDATTPATGRICLPPAFAETTSAIRRHCCSPSQPVSGGAASSLPRRGSLPGPSARAAIVSGAPAEAAEAFRSTLHCRADDAQGSGAPAPLS
jgi:hypothetical protein